MTNRICPGLPSDWLNAWLAAIGVTVLAPTVRLAWTDDPVPLAVLSAPVGDDPTALLAAAWPTPDRIDAMPIAEHHTEATRAMARKVPLDTWTERALIARRAADDWTLSSTVTDLAVDDHREVTHGRFDPPGPGTIKWLHHRLKKTSAYVTDVVGQIDQTLTGTGDRVQDNGLGFDIRRFSGDADEAAKHVDPVIEMLAFFGLALFPVRGTGTEGKNASARQRGWSLAHRVPVFHYPTWAPPLSSSGVDALLDLWETTTVARRRLLGVTSSWATEPYKTQGDNDVTVGYGSRRSAV